MLLAAVGLTAVMLYPCYAERGAYLTQNAQWLVESRERAGDARSLARPR